MSSTQLRETYLRWSRSWSEGRLRRWNVPLKVTFAAVLLVLIARAIDPERMLAAMKRADGWALAAAMVLLVPNVGLQYVKWRSLVRAIHPEIPRAEIFRSLLSGFALALFTPARVGEFGGRALGMAGARKSALIALTAVDKFVSLAVTVAAGIAGLSVYLQRDGGGSAFAGVCCAGVGVIAVGWVARARRAAGDTGRAVPRRLPNVARIARRIRTAVPRVSRSMLLKQLAFSAVFYATFCAQFLLLLSAFVPVDIGRAAAGIACVMFAKSVIPPVTFGELGIREGASVFFLGGFGFAAAAALNASFLLFCINIVTPAALGGIVLAHRSLSARGMATAPSPGESHPSDTARRAAISAR